MAQVVDAPHPPIREEWLALRREEILLPELPIVDPHHHLWDRAGSRYLLPELLADVQSGHNGLTARCSSNITQRPLDCPAHIRHATLGFSAQQHGLRSKCSIADARPSNPDHLEQLPPRNEAPAIARS